MLKTRCSCRCLALVLKILLFVELFGVVIGNLDLYVTKDHLKNNLNWDFGSDMYIVKDGEPASLLQNPVAFRDFVSPLPPTVKKVRFEWKNNPNGAQYNILYQMDAKSYNWTIMRNPIISKAPSGVVPWYGGEFEIEFPCTGLVDGLVDLSFTLNYTSKLTNKKTTVDILLKRHCRYVPPAIHHNSTSIRPRLKRQQGGWSRGLIIGLSASGALIMCVLGCCFIYCIFQKRNRKLQLEFDTRYELKKKYELDMLEECASKRPRCENSDKDVLLDINEHDELLKEELDSPSNPVFMPKRKTSHRKWKRSRRYRPQLNLPSEGTPPPAYSPGNNNPISPGGFGRALEKIPEEDYNIAGDSFSETDEDSSSSESTIVNMSHFSHANSCSSSSSIDSSFSSSVSDSVRDNNDSIDSSTSSTSDWSSDCSREQKRPRELFFKNKKQKYIPVSSSASDSGLSSGLSESVHRKANSARSCNVADNQGYQVSPPHRGYPPPAYKSSPPNIISNHQAIGAHLEQRPAVGARNTEDLFKVLNEYWREQFCNCILTQSQVIVDTHPLGKGAFGRVHRGKAKGLSSTDSNKLISVAVKVMIPSTDFDNISSFVGEALVMKNFHHENVLELLGVVMQPSAPPLIVLPVMKHGDLNQFLRSARSTPRRHQSLSTRQLINFGLQISRGMEYLAKMEYVHRDLASRNCMVSSDLTIKIADFGLARDISEEHYRMVHKTRLPIKWMALESLTDYIFSQATDVWSFGVVLWELMTLGKQPYSGVENQHMEAHLQQGNRLSQPHNCPDEIYSIMTSCWDEQPSERPPFTELCKRLTTFEGKYRKYTLDYSLPALPV